MKAELPWKASGDFLAYLSGNIVIMCCIDSLACRFASFVRTVGRTEEAMSAAAAGRRRQRVRRRQRRLGRDRALLHGARLLDFKNWTQSQSCEVRRRLRRRGHRSMRRPPPTALCRSSAVGRAPSIAERTVGWVRLVSQSRQYRRVRF